MMLYYCYPQMLLNFHSLLNVSVSLQVVGVSLN